MADPVEEVVLPSPVVGQDPIRFRTQRFPLPRERGTVLVTVASGGVSSPLVPGGGGRVEREVLAGGEAVSSRFSQRQFVGWRLGEATVSVSGLGRVPRRAVRAAARSLVPELQPVGPVDAEDLVPEESVEVFDPGEASNP